MMRSRHWLSNSEDESLKDVSGVIGRWIDDGRLFEYSC